MSHISVQASTQERGGEGRGWRERGTHPLEQVCFAEIILGLTVLTLGAWLTPGPSCSKGQ